MTPADPTSRPAADDAPGSGEAVVPAGASEPGAAAPVSGGGAASGGASVSAAGSGAASASAPRSRGVVGPRRAHWILFFGLVAGVVILDQITKAWVVNSFQVNVAVPILGDYARIWLNHNTGALFGMFPDQAIVFAFFSFLVMGVIVYYESRAGASLLVTIALGLLLGGAIGNLIDRLHYNYVVDFMDIGIGTWRWYTFNVADAAISGSIVLLFLLALVPGLAEPAGDA